MTVQRYRKRPNQAVVAVRLDLETEGFEYRKWGDTQHCKAGDWIVDSGEDVYTVDAESFAQTYRPLGDGRYFKSAPVWAERADAAGRVETKESTSAYDAGDYIVSNDEAGTDRYAVAADKFERMYELDVDDG